MPAIWVDQANFEVQVDRLVPILEGVLTLIPGGAPARPLLEAFRSLVDNDGLREELIDLLNRATGAKPPR